MLVQASWFHGNADDLASRATSSLRRISSTRSRSRRSRRATGSSSPMRACSSPMRAKPLPDPARLLIISTTFTLVVYPEGDGGEEACTVVPDVLTRSCGVTAATGTRRVCSISARTRRPSPATGSSSARRPRSARTRPSRCPDGSQLHRTRDAYDLAYTLVVVVASSLHRRYISFGWNRIDLGDARFALIATAAPAARCCRSSVCSTGMGHVGGGTGVTPAEP